jgi:hypothetical protein
MDEHTNLTVRSALGGVFDRKKASLTGKPDVTSTEQSVVTDLDPVTEVASTFIVQTYRQREVGDFVFLQFIGKDGSFRVYLPPGVSDAIVRQRDAITTKNRRRAAKAEAQRRKAAGIAPGFAKKRAKKAKAGAPKLAEGT